jgi:hypothetical protein
VLSILIWWAIPAAAVLLAGLVLVVSRQVRARRADTSTLVRYQRARRVLAQSQLPCLPQVQVRLQPPAPADEPAA